MALVKREFPCIISWRGVSVGASAIVLISQFIIADGILTEAAQCTQHMAQGKQVLGLCLLLYN